MVRNIVFILLGLISFGAGFTMFIVGNSNSHLTELKSFWFTPIPLGLFFIIAGIAGIIKKTSSIKS